MSPQEEQDTVTPRKATYSDEPTRVQQLIGEFLTGQSGTSVGADGLDVRLTAGADAKDDCAVYDLSSPMSLVVGSDYIRGPKFVLYEMGLLSGFDIGYYLAVANVSDIAAMGATPIGVLSVVRYPHEVDDAEFQEVIAGIHQGCTDCGTLNVGGDIGNAERIILSATAFGVCKPGSALMRSGARPGDLLCVTGPCGLLGAAVAYFPRRDTFEKGLSDEVERRLLDGWKRPRARVAEGRILGTKAYATACQDTSDGLKATIEQIMHASDVGFRVVEEDVPVEAGRGHGRRPHGRRIPGAVDERLLRLPARLHPGGGKARKVPGRVRSRGAGLPCHRRGHGHRPGGVRKPPRRRAPASGSCLEAPEVRHQSAGHRTRGGIAQERRRIQVLLGGISGSPH